MWLEWLSLLLICLDSLRNRLLVLVVRRQSAALSRPRHRPSTKQLLDQSLEYTIVMGSLIKEDKQVKNKWGVYGLAVVLGVSLVVPAQAFFNPGRWMDPSEWFGNNNRNYGPPPRPMPAQAYPPAYGQPAPYTYPAPAMAPTPVAPPVTIPAPATTPAAVATPPATYNAPPTSAVYNEDTPEFIPSNSNSGLKWPDKQFGADRPRENSNFSFAPSGYLQGTDSAK